MYKLPSELGLQKIIFGNLSLLGISYQNKQKDNEYKKKFSNKDEMKRVMKVAIRYGIRFFASTSFDFNELAPTYLAAIKEIENEEELELSLITCIGIPLEFKGEKINDYKRWKTHLIYESKELGKRIGERFFDDPILNCRFGWKENLRAVKSYNIKELKKELKINWKLWEERVNQFSDYDVAWIEPGSEIDFLAISRIDLLEELLDINSELGYRSFLGSHHLGSSVPLIQERRVKKFDGYVTPVNELGVMMFPTKREAENAVKRTRKEGKLIVATKPFAGGRLTSNVALALNYVYTELKVDSCMMGIGSVAEAEQNFQAAKNII